MTPQVEPRTPEPPDVACWCCGSVCVEAVLIRLEAHPEVAVCLDCARSLQRRAQARREEDRRTLSGLVRGGVDRVRTGVMTHGWHERGALGHFLRWLDRFLP